MTLEVGHVHELRWKVIEIGVIAISQMMKVRSNCNSIAMKLITLKTTTMIMRTIMRTIIAIDGKGAVEVQAKREKMLIAIY